MGVDVAISSYLDCCYMDHRIARLPSSVVVVQEDYLSEFLIIFFAVQSKRMEF